MIEHWEKQWVDLFQCRQTKHFFEKLDQKLSKDLMKYRRKSYSRMVQLITGHNWLRRHNSIVKNNFPAEDSGCRFCDEDEESSFHILAKCPMFAAQRREWFHTVEMSHPFKLKAKQLMGFLRDINVEELNDL